MASPAVVPVCYGRDDKTLRGVLTIPYDLSLGLSALETHVVPACGGAYLTRLQQYHDIGACSGDRDGLSARTPAPTADGVRHDIS